MPTEQLKTNHLFSFLYLNIAKFSVDNDHHWATSTKSQGKVKYSDYM